MNSHAVVIEAAGGLVLANGRLAIVHRPKYDDWSLPKGHLEPGEDHETAARREVLEETGFVCRIVGDAGETRYTDRKGRPKRVRYFTMSVLDGTFTPNDEVDDLVWITGDETGRLSQAADRGLAANALGAAP